MVQFPQAATGPADNAALRAQLEAQVGFLSVLSLRAVDTVQRLNQLNMRLARELADAHLAACRDALACEDPAHMAAAALQRLQPNGERLRDYQHELLGVMAEAQARLPSPVAMPARAAGQG